MAMRRRLPPLNPLRTFEVAARCRSFTEAAEELNVTQAAVSRQIAVLEGYFGTPLFERDSRAVRLTDVGRQYYDDITNAFDDIEIATERIFNAEKLVRVRTYPTLAAKWLMPIVGEFMTKYPAVDLRIETGVRPSEFTQSDTDIVIQFGAGDWPDMRSHRLLHDEIAPVCSPSLMEKVRLETVHDFEQTTLLISKFRVRDWTDWLDHVEAKWSERQKKLTFESSLLTYQAAADGLGVAMGQLSLLKHDLEKGVLVSPFDKALTRNLNYWIVWSARRRLPKESRNFVDWLIARADPA